MIDFLGKKLTPYTDWDPSLNQCWRLFLLGKQRKYLGWDSWVKFPFSFTGVPQQWGSSCCQVGRKRAWTSLWVKSCIPGACTSGHFRERRKERSHNIASNKPRLEVWGHGTLLMGSSVFLARCQLGCRAKKRCFVLLLFIKHPRASLVVQWWRIHLQFRNHQRHEFSPWVGKIPWRKKWQTDPVFLPGESHGQRSQAGYSPKGCKRVGHDWSDWARIHARMHKTPGSVLFLKFVISTGWIKRFFCKDEVCFTEQACIF